MSAFELPDLYMPYPARCNPNVDSTRVHTKAWTMQMGMIGAIGAPGGTGKSAGKSAFTWDEANFDAHEFALLCGYTHPDLPPSELDLMSDWYVWLFFFDDYFLEAFKRCNDVAGGKRFLARLWQFLPLSGFSGQGAAAEPLPVPSNPVERGMAELWTRTCMGSVGSSPAWRARFVQHTKDTLETVQWEHYNIRHARVANPLEYVAMRRMVGGCVWAACLLERANGLQLPDGVLAARPVRIIHEAFADSEHLHNDLMSYSREVGQESENANGVLVFERFLDLDPQQAANVSTDVLSARLHQFEHTVLVELPLYFEEHGLLPQQRVDVLRYANGVMAWIAGAYEWHFHSSRYDLRRADTPPGMYGRPDYIGPTGLGTAASRVLESIGFRSHTAGMPSPKSGPRGAAQQLGARGPMTGFGSRGRMTGSSSRLALPAFYMPFAARRHPAVASARTHTRAWATDMGLFGEGVWTTAIFERDDVPLQAACCRPDADLPQLELTSDWCTWALFVNDYVLERFKRPRDLLGAKAFAGRLSSFVAGAGGHRVELLALAPVNAAERALANLWQRSAPGMSPELRDAFARRIQSYAESSVWDIFNSIQDRSPDPIDYCEMRRVSGRSELALSLVQLGAELDLPAAVLRDRFVTQLREAFCDVMPLRNDIFSYAKELSEGELPDGELRGVVVLQRFFGQAGQGTAASGAMAIANALVTARLEQFEHICTHYLPELFDDLALDEAARTRVRTWVERLATWTAGDLEWSRSTGRYADRADKRTLARGSTGLAGVLQGPTGIGTSAARIHDALRSAPITNISTPPSGATSAPGITPESAPGTAPTTLDEKLRELARRAHGR
jgi:germacradienol/geosmin synthase